MTGIVSFGAYVPQMRLQRRAIHEANRWFAPGLAGLASGERAIANWDEDSVTMAVEAARDCLGELDRTSLRSVILASTSFPYADRQNAGIVKEALNVPDEVSTLDIGQSEKAGVGALIQAFHAAAAGSVLVGASEHRRSPPASEAEMTNGDGAAFFVVGPEDGVAKLIGTYSLSSDFVDHFRADGESFDYGWESRWIRDKGYSALAGRALKGAIKTLGVAPEEIAHFVVGIPAKGVAAALAKSAGVPIAAVKDNLSAVVGNTGCAHPLLMLAQALETAQAGEKILVLGFGQGADVILVEATGVPSPKPPMGVSGYLSRAKKETNYLKFLTFTGNLLPELGKRAEFDQKPVLTAQYRNRRTVTGLVGVRNLETGTVQYPRSEISVSGAPTGEASEEDYPLADLPVRIATFTADNLTFTLDPPSYYGMVEFEGGGRMMAEFTDVDPEKVSVGAPMRMMFRIKAVDNRTGFKKYFWKAVPAVGRS